jgi:hypothetical protein
MHRNNTTYRLYVDLLDKVHTLWFDQHPPAWKGCLSQDMLKHHATELLDKRTYSHSYVDFLLSTYVYLRDAHHERFYHTSMMEQLFLMPSARPSATPPVAPTTRAATTTSTRCAWCHSSSLNHTMKVTCPGRNLATRNAQNALQSVCSVATANTICQQVATRLSGAPDSPIQPLIDEIRMAAMSSAPSS